MSSYLRKTKHPTTGEWQTAWWLDDYFAHHEYGVKFPDGSVFRPEGLETSDEITVEMINMAAPIAAKRANEDQRKTVEQADKIISVREKIDMFTRRIQLKEDWGAHSTIKKDLIKLCREWAMSCKPEDLIAATEPYKRGFETANRLWEENINKPL